MDANSWRPRACAEGSSLTSTLIFHIADSCCDTHGKVTFAWNLLNNQNIGPQAGRMGHVCSDTRNAFRVIRPPFCLVATPTTNPILRFCSALRNPRINVYRTVGTFIYKEHFCLSDNTSVIVVYSNCIFKMDANSWHPRAICGEGSPLMSYLIF